MPDRSRIAPALVGFVVERLEEGTHRMGRRLDGRHHGSRAWSPFGSALTDGLGLFVAEIYRRHSGADWTIQDADPKYIYDWQPVLDHPGLATPPWRQAIAVVNGVDKNRRRP